MNYREKFKENSWLNEKKEEVKTTTVTTELTVWKETLGEKIRNFLKNLFKRK